MLLGVLEIVLPTDEKAAYKLKLYNEVIIEFKEIMRQRDAENVPLMMIKVAQEVSKDARLKIKSENRDIEVKDAEKVLGNSMPKVIESVDDLAAMSANARKQIYQSHGYNEMNWRTLELRILDIKEIDAILQGEIGD